MQSIKLSKTNIAKKKKKEKKKKKYVRKLIRRKQEKTPSPTVVWITK